MADETRKTGETADVSPLSTTTPAWRPKDVASENRIGSTNSATPSQSTSYDETASDYTDETARLAPLVIGVAVAGLAVAGSVAFFVARRSASNGSEPTPVLSGDTLRNLTDAAGDQLDELRYTLKQQLVDRPYRATRPMRRQMRRSTAPLRRSVDSFARTTRDVQRNARDVQREAQHRWQRTMTGGRWWRRGMIWGGALGIVIGFLLAPKPGRELRDDLSRRFDQVRPQAEKLYQQGKAQVDRFLQSRQM
jgi:gas vesicle protein